MSTKNKKGTICMHLGDFELQNVFQMQKILEKRLGFCLNYKHVFLHCLAKQKEQLEAIEKIKPEKNDE